MNLLFEVNMRVALSSLTLGRCIDEWYSLNLVNLTTKLDMGAIRISVRYLHEVIMPVTEYSSLKEVRQHAGF